MKAAESAESQGLVAEPRKGRVFWLKKLALALASVVLLSYVLHSADWSEVGDLFGQLDLRWFLAALATVPVMVGLCVWKWQCLLAARHCRVGFARLTGIYVIGQFYNQLLPTSTGGDAVRTILLHRRINDSKLALGSVLVERFTGLAVLLFMALAAIVLTPGLWSNPLLVLLVFAGSVTAGGVMLVALSRSLTRLARRVTRRVALADRMLDKVLRFQDSLWLYGERPWVMALAMLLSVGFYVAAVLGVWFACLAFGQWVPLSLLFLIVPMIMIVTLLPLTLGGIGLWEWAFSAAFAAFGLSGALGLSVSLLLRIRDLLWTVGGYVIVSAIFFGADTVRWRAAHAPSPSAETAIATRAEPPNPG